MAAFGDKKIIVAGVNAGAAEKPPANKALPPSCQMTRNASRKVLLDTPPVGYRASACSYLPTNVGSRFSMIALTPSRASAVVNVIPWLSDS